ncbi:hypothetical protein ACFFHM_12930 [Halalkalibacter kiskunsagensis]|uniref:Uncharacterized protein n=1 Tax=Halalkalibacter kiskunsagensis TaxID=1548599 RepID=A0ABV6KDI4_9BACI
MKQNKTKEETMKLHAYKNGFFTFFIMYLVTVILNDLFFKIVLMDYKYIFSLTLVLMIVVYYITMALQKKCHIQ